MKWFKKLSTVILIILAHYYDYVLGRRACCTHFCITDDLEKSNEMITFCIDHVREFYDRKNAVCTPPQPPNAHLFCGSDNAANQAKNNYHFSWMVDYVEEDHGLQTIQQNFTAEQHGKGIWDAEGGGGKTGAETAALHGFEINTAYDLYTFLKQHHSEVTNSYHEALHQVDKREFHYFPRGTFLAFHPRRPKALTAIKPYYTFAVRRTGLPEVKPIFQRRHFCPCAPCTTGDYHHCLYQAFLGMFHLQEPVLYIFSFLVTTLVSIIL